MATAAASYCLPACCDGVWGPGGVINELGGGGWMDANESADRPMMMI
jgi:hypothetical protein